MAMTKELRAYLDTLSPMRRLWVQWYLYRNHDGDPLRVIEDARRRRQALNERLRVCTENGQIAVIESGRDCDGVRYWGHVHYLPATIQAYSEHEHYVDRWADGPFSLTIERPSAAKHVRRGSRDLTLEAFEDGHSHVIYD